jgi:hypothetical protein
MKRIGGLLAAIGCFGLLSVATLTAAVKTEEKARVSFEGALGRMVNMFGGKTAREGLTTTTAVKGDRKFTQSGDTGRIVDLAEEKIYEIDFKKQSYKVTTFEQMRQQIRDMQAKAKERQAKQESKPAGEKPPDYEVEVSSKATGATKDINGFSTKQIVTTVTMHEKGKTLEQGGGMVLTNDAWLAPAMPAMKEVVDFELRYWKKLDIPVSGDVSAEQMAAAAAMYPMLKDALTRAKTEGAKVDGTPVQTTVSVEAVQSPEQQQQQQTRAEDDSGGSGLSGMLARKMMRKKKDDESGSAAPLAKGHAKVMTMYSEVLSVSTDVAASDLALPGGFKPKD